jgi:hypothetical protein
LSDELASATQFLVQGSLQQWLGDIIAVEQVSVVRDDAVLRVVVEYVVQRTGQRQSATFERTTTT